MTTILRDYYVDKKVKDNHDSVYLIYMSNYTLV